jgi:hypothetical protein
MMRRNEPTAQVVTIEAMITGVPNLAKVVVV